MNNVKVNMMKSVLMLLMSVIVLSGSAQEKEAKHDPMGYTVVKSHKMCASCVELIESEMQFVKGVHKAKVDTKTYEIMVDYNPKKTDKDKIKVAISELGVNADEVPATKEGIAKLPACCKNEGCGKPKAEAPAEEAEDEDEE